MLDREELARELRVASESCWTDSKAEMIAKLRGMIDELQSVEKYMPERLTKGDSNIVFKIDNQEFDLNLEGSKVSLWMEDHDGAIADTKLTKAQAYYVAKELMGIADLPDVK